MEIQPTIGEIIMKRIPTFVWVIFAGLLFLSGCNQDTPQKTGENTPPRESPKLQKKNNPEPVAVNIRDKTLKLYSAINRAHADQTLINQNGATVDLVSLVIITNYISTEDFKPPVDLEDATWSYYRKAYRLVASGNDIGSFNGDDYFVLEMKQDSFSKKVCLALNAQEGRKSKDGEVPSFKQDLYSFDVVEEAGQGCGSYDGKYVYYRIVEIR